MKHSHFLVIISSKQMNKIEKKKWFGNPILGHFPPKYAQNCPSLKGYFSISYQLTIKWFGHSIVYRISDHVTESFFGIYKEHSHRTESRNGRFTHGVFVTNNQIRKYLEAFSKKGLCNFVLFTFLKKIKKRSERSVNYIWRYILFKLRKCVKIT